MSSALELVWPVRFGFGTFDGSRAFKVHNGVCPARCVIAALLAVLLYTKLLRYLSTSDSWTSGRWIVFGGVLAGWFSCCRKMDTIDVQRLTPEIFWKKYISKRIPVSLAMLRLRPLSIRTLGLDVEHVMHSSRSLHARTPAIG